ncbi:MAG: hypothetical protein EOO43_00155 [Flavobacterium sp.]|nr:MAG: hypothetical protein EOO43_00155 [Flavobacterium sp.]
MEQRKYYAQRNGKLEDSPLLNLQLLKKLFILSYNKLSNNGFFQKYFGYYCVDADEVEGELGGDVASVMFLALRKDNLWPIHNNIDSYSEDDLFSVIEFLHDYCSKPLEGDYHQYNNCGMHYHTFDDVQGKLEFRKDVNNILTQYESGFELSVKGEVLSLLNKDLLPLMEATIPSNDEENINSKLALAITKFRRHKSTLEDRRNVLRDLADVMEYLRPKLKDTLMSNDEKDIFNIANNFGIRHHNASQKVKYDKAIWYSWIFYYYLATIHASLRLIEKQASNN